jgi:O-antigen/teichoic acid export membrane protein
VSESEIKQQTSKNIAKSIGYGFLSWILPIGLTIYATPKILNGLGHTDYGVFSLILGFISYSFMFGIGKTVTKYIAEFRQTNENGQIQDIISATLFICTIVGLFGAGFITLTANRLTVEVFKIEPSLQIVTIKAFYLAAATIFVMMLSQVFNGIVQGIHRFDVYANVLNFNSFSTIIGNIILVYFGQSVLVLLSWNLLTTIITCLLYFYYAKLLFPEFKLSFKFNRSALSLVFRFSLGIVAYQVFGNLTFLVERGLITREFGTESLAYYVLPMTLALYIHAIITSLTMVIFPLASELGNQPEKLLSLYIKSTKIVCAIVFFIAGSLITTSFVFLTLWLGVEIADKSTGLLVIHTITFSFLAISIISWQLRDSLGFTVSNGVLTFFWFIISVSLMLYWVEPLGLRGIAMARMVGLIPMLLATFYFEKKVFGKSLFGFWTKLLITLTFSTLLASFAAYSVLSYMAVSWLALIISGLCSGIVFLGCLWLFRFFTEDEKLFFKKFIKR